MKRITLLIAFTMIAHTHLWAGAHRCSGAKERLVHKTTIASPAEDHYDVQHLRFQLQMTDTSVYLNGDVTTTAKVVVTSMPAYVFELDSSLTIDSVFINGSLVSSIATSGFLRTVTLSSPLSMGATFNARVYYHGMPPGGGGGFFNGITHAVTAAGTHMVYTVSDPYAARNWWPCKQSVTDKIDSVDMFVKLPAGVVDGSNGVLVQVDSTTTAGWWNYHWKTNYKIDYYLISIAIAKYTQYQYYHYLPSGTDSVLMHNFFLDTVTFNPSFKRNFDSLDQMMDLLSNLYGRYPFINEKYGVCYTNLLGGMEHQTMTTIGVPNTTVIAHELAHQWFGDNVTYKTWGDVWLSEGFATFSEQLYLAHFWSAAAGLRQRKNYISLALTSPCGKVYVNDTTTSDSLFSSANVYAKASIVVRMLQDLAPNDSVFFSLLRNYQTTYGEGLASTADLKAMAESMYGISLDTFFNQWIYGRGFPIYRASWNQVGSQVFVKLIQSTSCPSYTSRFSTPVELQLYGAAGDTTIRVYNNADTQVYQFTWSPTISTVNLNPNAITLCRQFGSVIRDATLKTASLYKHDNYKAYPNPTKTNWELDNLEAGQKLALYTMEGKFVWGGISSQSKSIIPAVNLPTGYYLLKIGNKSDHITLQKL